MNLHMLSMMGVPVAILAIESEEDRNFVQNLYMTYKQLMFYTARKYFGNDYAEIEDAVSSAVENMCVYVQRFREVDCNKLKAYVLCTIENVCNRRMRMRYKEKEYRIDYDQEMIDQVANLSNEIDNVFAYTDALSLLASFDVLSEREKEIMRMRHIDQMEFAEIAHMMKMKEGAVRTALTRAKQRVVQEALKKRGENSDTQPKG